MGGRCPGWTYGIWTLGSWIGNADALFVVEQCSLIMYQFCCTYQKTIDANHKCEGGQGIKWRYLDLAHRLAGKLEECAWFFGRKRLKLEKR